MRHMRYRCADHLLADYFMRFATFRLFRADREPAGEGEGGVSFLTLPTITRTTVLLSA